MKFNPYSTVYINQFHFKIIKPLVDSKTTAYGLRIG